MKKYLIKEVSTATDDNPNFRGEVQERLYGKGMEMIMCKGTKYDDFDFSMYKYEEYGYDRECDAKKSWVYKNPENTKYWTSTVEIVCVEI